MTMLRKAQVDTSQVTKAAILKVWPFMRVASLKTIGNQLCKLSKAIVQSLEPHLCKVVNAFWVSA